MGSAIAIPAAENGHTLRLVGTPLDREIIDHARKTGYHLNLKRQLHPSFTYYQIEQLDEALQGADLLIGGVSSFGVDWFVEHIPVSYTHLTAAVKQLVFMPGAQARLL